MNRIKQGFVMASGMVLAVLAASSPAAAQDANAFPETVTVYNRRPVPVVVYLDQGDFDSRLGTVPAYEAERLALPRYLDESEPVELVVHPKGETALSAGPITLEVGKKMEVLVPSTAHGALPSSPLKGEPGTR